MIDRRPRSDHDPISESIIGAAIEVHRCLGPGLLESIYEECLVLELSRRNLSVDRQRLLPIAYKSQDLDCYYRVDLIVQNAVVVEIKSVERLAEIHTAQVLT
jgi:GxxExxY protein